MRGVKGGGGVCYYGVDAGCWIIVIHGCLVVKIWTNQDD